MAAAQVAEAPRENGPGDSLLFDFDALEVSAAKAPLAPAPAASGAYQWPATMRRPESAPQPGEQKSPAGASAAAAAPRERQPPAGTAAFWEPPGAGRAEAALVANGLGGQRVLLLLRGAGADAEGDRGDEEASCSIVDAVRRLLGNCTRWPPPLMEPRPAFFSHHDPQHPTIYGGWFGRLRAPTVLLEAPSEGLARYLREDPEGPFARVMDEAEWSRWGFVRDRWQHSLLKADWHTLPQLGAEGQVWVPRVPAARVVKRAPPRMMAFMSVFRSINQACWLAMMETLVGVRRARVRQSASSSRVRQFDAVASCLQSQRHFGVLEAQVRWGAHRLRGPSHKDGATSLLHLGLTLGGRRVLRIGAFPSGNAAGNKQHNPWNGGSATGDMDPKERDVMLGEADVWDEDLWPKAYLKDIEMVPGSTYLSSPFCVEHGVQYCSASEEDPVIAVQCRFGFNGAVGKELNDDRSEDMREIASIIAESFRAASVSGQLRMPTVGEVQREEARLRAGGA